MKFKQVISYKNASDQKSLLIIEPWAEQYSIEPGDKVDIAGEGGDSSSGFDIQHAGDMLVIFGWVGSIIKVWRNGMEVVPSKQI